ncbi:MAG: tRNA (adenosine(37)-N6)-threonylcarbamoyltransferase complex ATPase subunit type 1 TsaE [Clostridiales bacterium]|nr:tRNA (adenosine(37)-N6)-threonylcarbamoyltransferase complex ATPase subunit type 1 TsaE [Clostridiales bacterium]
MEIKVVSNNESTTQAIAQKYAQSIKAPCVISLKGDLGAGKTTFAKGFAKGLGINEVVTSPTFTIMNEYEGKMPLYHFDMYRLSSKEEAINCGFEEYFDLTKLQGVVLVEWAENVEGLLPALHVEVNFKKLNESDREIAITVKGWV